MKGVENINGDSEGSYRDGGIIDYHPCFDFTGTQDKIVLYHHFYNNLTPGWFDKRIFWRRAEGKDLDNTLLISSPKKFVDSLTEKEFPTENISIDTMAKMTFEYLFGKRQRRKALFLVKNSCLPLKPKKSPAWLSHFDFSDIFFFV